MNNRFTTDEISYLIDNYSYEQWDILIANLHKNKNAIISKASSLNLKRKSYYWTEEDVNILKYNYMNYSVQELFLILNNKFTESAIYTKLSKLGYIKNKKWTNDEIELLKSVYEVMDIDEVCNIFSNRDKETIKTKAHVYHLISKTYNDRFWTNDEIDILKQYYGSLSLHDLSLLINKTTGGIRGKAFNLGLKKDRYPIYDDLSEFIRGKNCKWKRDSCINSNYKCVISSERFTDIHHLYGMNMIIQETLISLNLNSKVSYKELTELEIHNILVTFFKIQSKYPLGICLSKHIHTQFHKECGFGNNTPEQFYEFCRMHNYKITTK